MVQAVRFAHVLRFNNKNWRRLWIFDTVAIKMTTKNVTHIWIEFLTKELNILIFFQT